MIPSDPSSGSPRVSCLEAGLKLGQVCSSLRRLVVTDNPATATDLLIERHRSPDRKPGPVRVVPEREHILAGLVVWNTAG